MDWFKILLFCVCAASVTSATEKVGLDVFSLWHTSTGQIGAFYQGRGILIHLIDGLAEGTNVFLKIINADANIDIQFQKESANFTWRNKIMHHKPCNTTGNNIISSNDISEAVFKYFDQNKKQKRAEEVFLIVTDRSVIDNEGRVKEALSKKKTFVVVCGIQTGRNVWTDLATDNNHLKELQESSNHSFYSIKESLLKLSLKDSNLLCDTDEYYTGERCYRCSYICSSSPSEYCLKECRYFNHPVQETDSIHNGCVSDQDVLNTIKTLLIVLTFLSILLVTGILVILLVFCWLKKRYMEMKSDEKKDRQEETEFLSE